MTNKQNEKDKQKTLPLKRITLNKNLS